MRRFAVWWKEWGATFLSLSTLLVTLAVWYFGRSGWLVLGPSDAAAQAVTMLDARADRDSALFATLADSGKADRQRIWKAIDSSQRDVNYALRAIEAGNRVVCFRDRPAAEVAGILCPSGKVPR